jgi:hypothetical protein
MNQDIRLYTLPNARSPMIINPTWLHHVSYYNLPIYERYIQGLSELFTYIIQHNKLTQSTELHVGGNEIYKAIAPQYTSRPAPNSTNILPVVATTHELQAIWFAKQSVDALQYRQQGRYLLSRQILPIYSALAYIDNDSAVENYANTETPVEQYTKRVYGATMFLSFDSRRIPVCNTADLYYIDMDLITLIYNLINIKVGYLTSEGQSHIDVLDPIYKIQDGRVGQNGERTSYMISDIFDTSNNPPNRVDIPIDHIQYAYGRIDGTRNSSYTVDLYIMHQINEILSLIQFIIRRQTNLVITPELSSQIESNGEKSGINPVIILGMYLSHGMWNPIFKNSNCQKFTSELTISGFFLTHQLNGYINFLNTPNIYSNQTLGGRAHTSINNNNINIITKKNKGSRVNNLKKSITLKNKSAVTKQTREKSLPILRINRCSDNKRYTLDEINDYLFLIK